MFRVGVPGLTVVIGFPLLMGCEKGGPNSLVDSGEPLVLLDSEKKLDHLTLCSPTAVNFPSPLTSTNPYFPIVVDYQWTLESDDELLIMTVLDETREIDGIITRVVEEREFEGEEGDLELAEISWNYFAEAGDGTVCYFGEDVDDIEEGEVEGHEGRWCAEDVPDVNKGGIIMPADPQPGMMFQNEDAPDFGAVDEAKIVGSGPVTVPFDTFTQTIRFREFNPEDKEKGYKVFASDLATGFGGIIIDEDLVLTDFTQTAVDPGAPSISEQVCGS